MIYLRKMSEPEFAAYMERSIPSYAEEKMKGEGMSQEDAHKLAIDSFGRLLPNGLQSPEQFLFSVVEKESEKLMGTFWFARKLDSAKKNAFIYDIILHSEARGRGWGELTMKLAMEEIRKLGLTSVGLHVFGHNEVAVNLYKKLGFRPTNIMMTKDL